MGELNGEQVMTSSDPSRTTIKLVIATVVMFGFGYALAPLYNVFCEITGLNGKTGTITEQQAANFGVDESRLVTVEFDTNINGDLPWSFKAMINKAQVHPGKSTDVEFVVENNSSQVIVGQAIPSVAPAQASLFFKKTECFCFTRQTLAPHERRQMRVRFVVGPELPKKISTLTLSYTFFQAPEDKQAAQDAVQLKITTEKQTSI